MKTKELIAELIKLDPSGEGEVCVGNSDIHFVEALPAYYDGCLQRLIVDSGIDNYNIVAAKFVGTGSKISIHVLSIYDAIFNDIDLPISYEGISKEKADSYQKSIEDHRQKAMDIYNSSECGLFVEYIIKRLSFCGNGFGFDIDEDEIKTVAATFFNSKMSYADKMPDDIAKLSTGYSRYGKRCLQWDREISIDLADGKLILGFTDQYSN